jgi:hypothetical protein
VQVATYTPEQQKVVKTILRVGRQRGASPKELKAAIETGLVESGLRNLSGGDADSAGWRQERASLYPDPTNVQHSAARFFDEAKRANASGRYGSAGSLAAAVQRPAAQFRGRYQQRSGDADALLGNPSNGGGVVNDTAGTVTTTTTPGVDNSGMRRQLVADFLSQGGVKNSQATAAFATGYKAAQDVPGRTTTTRSKGRLTLRLRPFMVSRRSGPRGQTQRAEAAVPIRRRARWRLLVARLQRCGCASPRC